jgi:dienelactone hydrolase
MGRCVDDQDRSRRAVFVQCAAIVAALTIGCGDSAAQDADATSSSSETTDASSSSESSEPDLPEPDVPEFCAGAVALLYDPGAGRLDAFPDDALTDDASTDTGVRVRDLSKELANDEPLAHFPSMYAGLATLDGFGTTAPAFLRLTHMIDPESLPAPGTETDASSSTLVLVDLDASEPTLVEFDWRLVDEAEKGATLFVTPLRPLRAGARHGLVLTRAARDEAGDCIAPSPTMQAVLSGDTDDPTLARTTERVAELLEALGVVDPTEVSAALVFTTQTNLAENTAIATAIGGAMPPPDTPIGCISDPYEPYRVCEVVLKMADFTDESGVVVDAPVPQGFYDLPVTAYLPKTGTAPFPTVIFAHALTGDRSSAWWHAWLLAQYGFAVLAIDAPKHGDHPDVAVNHPALDLIGLSVNTSDPFHALDARDNFRQAAYDKLQLLRRIEAGLNVDADGKPDFDFARLHYYGVSLGAVMAPQFLAYAPSIRSAVLTVGGAQLTEIVQGEEFSELVALVTPALTPTERMRLLAIAEATLDRGEPAVFAQHVLSNRLEGFEGGTLNLLAQLAVDDAIVPNASTAALARALGLPIVGPVPFAIRGLELHADLPTAGNMGTGQTAGLCEFTEAESSRAPDGREPADHYNLQHDPFVQSQVRAFITTAEDDEGATIVDPYGP